MSGPENPKQTYERKVNYSLVFARLLQYADELSADNDELMFFLAALLREYITEKGVDFDQDFLRDVANSLNRGQTAERDFQPGLKKRLGRSRFVKIQDLRDLFSHVTLDALKNKEYVERAIENFILHEINKQKSREGYSSELLLYLNTATDFKQIDTGKLYVFNFIKNNKI